MAENTIGNASLQLSANGGKLEEGLKQAESKISAWGTKAGGLVKTAFAGTVGAVAGTISKAIQDPFKKLDEFASIQKQADTLGVSASEFAGFQKQLATVGVEGDKVKNVFAIMGKNIQAAKEKSGGLTEELDGTLSVIDGQGKAKAFEKLGIDLDTFASKPYGEQFKAIADGISKLPKGSEQAAAAMAVFGKSGAELLPVLQQGGAGIDAFIAKQKQFGTVLSDEQYKAAADAAKAWKAAKKEIAASWEGLTNRATLVAAPVVEFIGKGMSKALAFLTPVFQALGEGLETASVILTKFGEEASKWFDQIGQQIGSMIKSSGLFGDNWVSAADVVKGAFYVLGTVAAGFFDIVKGGIAQLRLMVADVLEMRLQILALAAVLDNKGIQEANAKLAAHQAETEQLKRDRANAFEFNSAKQFQEWFLKQDFNRKMVQRQPEGPAAKPEIKIDPSSIKQVAAMLEGSAQAYDVEARFKTAQLVDPRNVQEKQLAALNEVARLVAKLVEESADAIRLAPG